MLIIDLKAACQKHPAAGSVPTVEATTLMTAQLAFSRGGSCRSPSQDVAALRSRNYTDGEAGEPCTVGHDQTAVPTRMLEGP